MMSWNWVGKSMTTSVIHDQTVATMTSSNHLIDMSSQNPRNVETSRHDVWQASSVSWPTLDSIATVVVIPISFVTIAIRLTIAVPAQAHRQITGDHATKLMLYTLGFQDTLHGNLWDTATWNKTHHPTQQASPMAPLVITIPYIPTISVPLITTTLPPLRPLHFDTWKPILYESTLKIRHKQYQIASTGMSEQKPWISFTNSKGCTKEIYKHISCAYIYICLPTYQQFFIASPTNYGIFRQAQLPTDGRHVIPVTFWWPPMVMFNGFGSCRFKVLQHDIAFGKRSLIFLQKSKTSATF